MVVSPPPGLIRRVEGWPLKLSGLLRTRRDMDFAWGSNDCLIFSADAVLSTTHFDPAARWRGYQTMEEAHQIIREYGGVEALINYGLGIQGHRDIMRARRGDIVSMKIGGNVIAGVVDDSGQRIAAVTEGKGLIRLPLHMAWRIWSY